MLLNGMGASERGTGSPAGECGHGPKVQPSVINARIVMGRQKPSNWTELLAKADSNAPCWAATGPARRSPPNNAHVLEDLKP